LQKMILLQREEVALADLCNSRYVFQRNSTGKPLLAQVFTKISHRRPNRAKRGWMTCNAAPPEERWPDLQSQPPTWLTAKGAKAQSNQDHNKPGWSRGQRQMWAFSGFWTHQSNEGRRPILPGRGEAFAAANLKRTIFAKLRTTRRALRAKFAPRRI
jgi:hypothetical protein